MCLKRNYTSQIYSFHLKQEKKSNAHFTNEETKVKDRERSSQVTLICRTEIFILRIHFQGPLVTAQVLRDLDGSHITKPPNKPSLLVLLCLSGAGAGFWQGRERQVVRRSRRQIPMKAQAFIPKKVADMVRGPNVRLANTVLLLNKPACFTCPQVGVQVPYFSMEPCSLGNRSPNRLLCARTGKKCCHPKPGQRVHTGNIH